MVSKFYVFDVITPFHLISSLAFCLSKGRRGDVVSVNIIPGMKGDLLLDEADFITSSGIRVLINKQKRCAGIKGIFSFFLHRYLWIEEDAEHCIYIGHHTYFKPSVLFFLLERYRGKKIIVFSFEEGVGSYNSLSQEKAIAKREGKKFFFLKYFLKKILGRFPFVDINWGVIKRAAKTKSDIQDYHRESAREIGVNLYPSYINSGVQSIYNNKKNKKVLFFTSPLVELGLLRKEEYSEFMESVKRYFEKKMIDMYVKPHPLDVQDYSSKFPGEQLVKTAMPSEVHLMMHHYHFVAGVNSGALLTANVMYGIRAINFYNMLPTTAKNELMLGSELEKIFQLATSNYTEI
jgi:hypothetical protein